jgi:hypothetical protein
MSILPLTVPPKRLAQTISSTAMSFKLNNIRGWENLDIESGDFGTEAYVVFLNSTRTQIEIMKIDPATIANESITILARGLGYSGGDISDASRQFPWVSNDTIVQLGTDAPQLFRDFMSETNPATVQALHTYDVLPQSAVSPVADEDFTNKEYVDGLTQPAITVRIEQVAHGFVVGDVIRLSGVNTYAKAQADSPANAEVIGIVTAVDDADNFRYITEGIVTTGVPVFAAGTVLFLSRTTAGELVDTDTNTIGEVSFPLAVISESGVKMIFHKYRPAVINSISGNPVASETVAGMVEQATPAQVAAKTDVGETGAPLFVVPSLIPNLSTAVRSYLVSDSPAVWTKPDGLQFLAVFLWSGGNSGSATARHNGGDRYAGGGGGGGYAFRLFRAIDLLASENIVIGPGGAAVVANGDAFESFGGLPGSLSSFGGTKLIAYPGIAPVAAYEGSRGGGNWAAGQGGVGGAPQSSIVPGPGLNNEGAGGGGSRISAPVTAQAGANAINGGAGGGAASVISGVQQVGVGGVSVNGGNGGDGVIVVSLPASAVGEDGAFPGGGGGAAVTMNTGFGFTATSGKGGDGLCILVEYF